MPVYSTTAAGAQDGCSLGGVWNEATYLYLGVALSAQVGLQFPVFDTWDSEGRPLDPPIFHPTIELTLVAYNIVWHVYDHFDIEVWTVPEPDPAPYSNTLMPGARDEILLTEVEWPNPDTELTISIPTADMQPYLREARWNGIICFTLGGGAPPLATLALYSAETGPADAPSIETTEQSAFTGIEGHGVEYGRPCHDMKTGLPVHVGDLVEDGYHPGVWTVPEQWDPADPRDDHPVEFPDSEGQWDDDVPAS